MGLFGRLKRAARFVAEKLNVKTARDLKGDLSSMSDEELLAKRGSTVRSVSGCVTGFAINLALSLICPPYAVVAAINAVQIGVSSTNTHRVRREIKDREARSPVFKALAKSNSHSYRDIGIGVGIKAGLSVLSLGLIGGGEVLNHFHEFALHHPIHHAAGNLAGDYVAQNVGDHTGTIASSLDGHGQGSQNSGIGPPGKDWVKLNEFKVDHAHITNLDSMIHKAANGISDQVVGYIGQDGIKLDDATTAADVHHFVETKGPVEVGIHMVAAGAAMELLQPVQQLIEGGVDMYKEQRDKEKIKVQLKTASIHSGQVAIGTRELNAQAQILQDFKSELAEKLRKRPARGVAAS